MTTPVAREQRRERHHDDDASRASGSHPWWSGVGRIAIALILGLGVLALIWLLAMPLAMLVLAIALAEAFEPPAHWLKRWMPRTLAIVLLYLLTFVIVGGMIAFVIPTFATQVQQLSGNIGEYLGSLRSWLDELGLPGTGELLNQAASQLGQFASVLVTLPLKVLSSLLLIFLVVVISIYWLIEAPRVKGFALSLFRDDQREKVAQVIEDTGSAMGGYARGVAINAIIVGILSYIGLTIIGVPFALVLALTAALLELIPYIGPVIAGLLMVAAALLESPTTALIVLGFVVVLQQAENHLLVPNIMHSQTDISPLLVVLALFVGSTIGGLLGALAAVPLAAALKVLTCEVVAPALRGLTGAAADRSPQGGAADAESDG